MFMENMNKIAQAQKKFNSSSWFVHRTGRTGRQGREGNALLLLANEQAAYVEFVSKHEKVFFNCVSECRYHFTITFILHSGDIERDQSQVDDSAEGRGIATEDTTNRLHRQVFVLQL